MQHLGRGKFRNKTINNDFDHHRPTTWMRVLLVAGLEEHKNDSVDGQTVFIIRLIRLSWSRSLSEIADGYRPMDRPRNLANAPGSGAFVEAWEACTN